MSLTRATVLVVHRIPLIRFALTALINLQDGFTVCGAADSAANARRLFERHHPQLVLLGLTLAGGDGIALIRDFCRLRRGVRCVVLTTRADALSVQRAFRAGATGYIVAGDETAEITATLASAWRGELHASKSVCRALLEHLAHGDIGPVSGEIGKLSERELEVFMLLGRGFGNSRSANELHLSVKTIETHQMHIKQKLGLESAAELSEKASRWMSEAVRTNLPRLQSSQCKSDSIFS